VPGPGAPASGVQVLNMVSIGDLFSGVSRIAQVIGDSLLDFGFTIASNPAYLLIAGIALVVLALTLLRAR
jgi:hypothetical protein